MTVNDILILVRQRLGDMGKLSFTDAELIYCLNNAMDEVCMELYNSYDPEIIKTVTLTSNGFDLPEDFIAWQGQYPLDYTTKTTGKTLVTPLDPDWGGENNVLRYFAFKPHFTSLNDVIPFRTGIQQKELMTKCIYQVKPKQGGDTSDGKGTSDTGSGTGTA